MARIWPMVDSRHDCKPKRRAPRPLDAARLEELALSYVARFSTTSAKLERYLARKVRERGWAGERAPALGDLVEKFCQNGYVDDAAWAKSRSGGLLRRGYGPRRVRQALGEAGVAQSIREQFHPDEAEQRRAVLAMARKRRFGPFGSDPLARDKREKQLAAFMRAGHSLDNARQMVDAASVEAAESWAAELEEDKDWA